MHRQPTVMASKREDDGVPIADPVPTNRPAGSDTSPYAMKKANCVSSDSA